MSYLKNAWYVAGWAEELKSGAGLARRLLDEPIFLFRTQRGVAQALADVCPHRFAPLHKGLIKGDAVHCGYHGLAFEGSGLCVHNPHGAIPAAARVRSYPLVERHRLLWIWMGASETADAATIPDFSFQNPEQVYTGQRYLTVNAAYELEIENIMDLSHIQFLHPTTLGGTGVTTGQYEAEQDGARVWSKRNTTNELVPAGLAQAMGLPPEARIDRWMEVCWHAPANMVLYAGGVQTGRPRTEGMGVAQAHCFTPESPTRSHYWFSISFPKAMGPMGAKMAEDQADWLKVPFETEDLPMLQAQQTRIAEIGDRRAVLLAGDAGGVLALRKLHTLIRAEQKQA